MASRSDRASQKPRPKPRAPASPPASPTAAPIRDLRPRIYGVLDLVFAVAYAFAIWKVIPNRLPSAALHLWTFPIATLAIAAGMLLGGPRGWRIAVVGGSLVLLSVFLLIVRIVISAAFLAGVYGGFGKAASTFALVMIALVIELVALLPLVQVKYLMSRAGRRAMGVPAP
ncbi:MAG: hypothetical protein ABIY55_03645 [Kofleriaceae bacterium]